MLRRPVVTHPLPHVADHVVQAVAVLRPEREHGCCACIGVGVRLRVRVRVRVRVGVGVRVRVRVRVRARARARVRARARARARLALSCVAVLRGVVAREGALEDVRPVHAIGHEALAPG